MVILGHAFPFHPPKKHKNQNFEKWKIYWRYHRFTCVPKITIICYTVPEIWSETDRIFWHFGPFFAPLPPFPLMILKIKILKKKLKIYHKWRSYDHSLPFQPLDNPENQNFKTEKKTHGDIILHICTITENHMMYGSWDMEHHGEAFLSFWAILHFYSPNSWKNQNFEEMKKAPGDTIILHMCNINENHMIYGSWDMEHDRLNFLSSWTVFCLFTPLTTRKTKILKKMNKTSEDIIILHMCTSNNNHTMYGSWDMTCGRQNFL